MSKLSKQEIINQLEAIEAILDSDSLPHTEQDLEQAVGALEDEDLKFAYDLIVSASNKVNSLNQHLNEIKNQLSQLINSK